MLQIKTPTPPQWQSTRDRALNPSIDRRCSKEASSSNHILGTTGTGPTGTGAGGAGGTGASSSRSSSVEQLLPPMSLSGLGGGGMGGSSLGMSMQLGGCTGAERRVHALEKGILFLKQEQRGILGGLQTEIESLKAENRGTLLG